jgi:hypothetical protein
LKETSKAEGSSELLSSFRLCIRNETETRKPQKETTEHLLKGELPKRQRDFFITSFGFISFGLIGYNEMVHEDDQKKT